MSWQNQDSPKSNNIDRVFVSQTEYWEVHYFVDHYLKSNNYDITDSNRQIVKDAMKQYTGRAPVKREDLTQFLDNKFKKK